MVRNIFALYPKMDIRDVLPSIQVPTLVLHRRDDRMVSVDMGRYLADHIPGAKFVELEGTDHLFFTGDADAILDEIQEFLTGRPPPARRRARVVHGAVHRRRRLHQRAVDLGDERWKELLTARRPGQAAARALPRSRGEHDWGRLSRDVRRSGPGDPVRGRDPRRLGVLGLQVRVDVHTGEVECGTPTSPASPSISRPALPPPPQRARCSSPARSSTSSPARAHVHQPRRARPQGVPGEWRLFAVED